MSEKLSVFTDNTNWQGLTTKAVFSRFLDNLTLLNGYKVSLSEVFIGEAYAVDNPSNVLTAIKFNIELKGTKYPVEIYFEAALNDELSGDNAKWIFGILYQQVLEGITFLSIQQVSQPIEIKSSWFPLSAN